MCPQGHGEEQGSADDVLTPRRALDEAFELVDKEANTYEEVATTGTNQEQLSSVEGSFILFLVQD